MPVVVGIVFVAGIVGLVVALRKGSATAMTSSAAVEAATSTARGISLAEKLHSIEGTPYIWGGKSPETGLDCSGAVSWALGALGYVPKGWYKNTSGLFAESTPVAVPVIGDLVFYGPSGTVNHVMVYAGNGQVVGATGGTSKTSTVAEALAAHAEVKTRPLGYRKDFIRYGRLPVVA